MKQSKKGQRCLFGTDGVRDIANRGSMTPEMALRLGRAYVLFLTERGMPCPAIVVGRDSRLSGPMLEAALISGMTSAGADVVCVGVTPTPAVSFGIKLFKAQGGAVISASHNPAEYNGIKFLDAHGSKLSDDDELEIEEYLGDNLIDEWRPSGASIGEISHRDLDFNDFYAQKVVEVLGDLDFSGKKILFDCANGAASPLISSIVALKGLSESEFINYEPDGLNINEKSGVMHMDFLSEETEKRGMDVGIAYDGDADRVLLCDSRGRVIDGDIMLWVLARWFKQRETLGAGVVATVMSNMALEHHLAEEGIDTFRCPVGDRYVLQTMKDKGASVGGEQSGHVIIDPFTQTGDGLCTGFLFLRACEELSEDLDTLVDRFGRFPQKLINISVLDKNSILQDETVNLALDEASHRLGTSGRVFLRPSGTEPLIRLLVECQDSEEMENISSTLADHLRKVAK